MEPEDTIFLAEQGNEQDLSVLASEIFAILGIEEHEERFSDNSPNGHYFAGYASNVVVEVCDEDTGSKPGYPYYLSLHQPSWRRGSKSIVDDVHAIAKTLAAKGYRGFVPTRHWGSLDWDGSGRNMPSNKSLERPVRHRGRPVLARDCALARADRRLWSAVQQNC